MSDPQQVTWADLPLELLDIAAAGIARQHLRSEVFPWDQEDAAAALVAVLEAGYKVARPVEVPHV